MSDEWLEDGSPAGGVGTITRPPAEPGVQPRRTHRPHRPARRGAGWGAPSRQPKGATREEGGQKAPAGEWGKQGTQRVPFFFMLCGLLGGALVCALVISTTLAEGSFQITRLQQANTSLAKQRQLLAEQVAAAQSAQVIQARALQLGMRPVGQVRFLNLKNGKIQTDAGSGAVADIHVPGYTP